jgi:hypothetical protein
MSNFDTPSAGNSSVSLTLSYPESAFLYRATKPRLLLDGSPVDVSGWGQQILPVSPGLHRVQVWVPYALPRRAGRADLTVTVPDNGTLDLEYMAPTLAFAKGSLGVPGEQKSTGQAAVRMANIVTVVLVVATIVFLILR